MEPTNNNAVDAGPYRTHPAEKNKSLTGATRPDISVLGRANIDLDDQIFILSEHVNALYELLSSVYQPSEPTAERKPLYDDAPVSEFTGDQRRRVEKLAATNAAILFLMDHVEL